MLAYKHVRISCIRAPAHGAVKQLLICEARQEPSNCLFDRDLRDIGVGVCRVFGVGSWDRDGLWGRGAVGLVLFEAREAREFVADFDDAVPFCVSYYIHLQWKGLLVGLEEETVVAVVYHWGVFILGCFGGCELDMGEYPGLS